MRCRRRHLYLWTEKLHGYRWRCNRDIDHAVLPCIRSVVAISEKDSVYVDRFPGQQTDAIVEGVEKFLSAGDVGLEKHFGQNS